MRRGALACALALAFASCTGPDVLNLFVGTYSDGFYAYDFDLKKGDVLPGEPAKAPMPNPSFLAIDGNKITVTSHTNEHETVVEEYIVTDINDKEFTANRKLTVTFDGTVRHTANEVFRLTKQTADYREAILGTWEGKVTSSEGSEFDDGETHRWEYKADGTYVYYVKDGDDWVPYEGNTLNEYFVDGTLLCTRWIDNDVENREWWEIVSIKNDVMKWKGLRQKEDGSTYTATFEMRKVE